MHRITLNQTGDCVIDYMIRATPRISLLARDIWLCHRLHDTNIPRYLTKSAETWTFRLVQLSPPSPIFISITICVVRIAPKHISFNIQCERTNITPKYANMNTKIHIAHIHVGQTVFLYEGKANQQQMDFALSFRALSWEEIYLYTYLIFVISFTRTGFSNCKFFT